MGYLKLNDANLVIQVRLHGNQGIASIQLTTIIDAIEHACYKQEIDALVSIFESENVPWLEEFAHRARQIWNKRASTLMITNAKQGSIILEGAVIAVTTWLLLNTVGETMKDSWKETGLHQKLKNLLLNGTGVDRNRLVNEIDNHLEYHRIKTTFINRKQVELIEEYKRQIILVDIEVRDELERINEIGLSPKEMMEISRALDKRKDT